MTTSVVGSVTAELLLNTEKFSTQIKEAKTMVKGLNGSFGNTGTGQLKEKLAQLEAQIQKTTEKIEKQKTTINKQKETINSLQSQVTSLNSALSSNANQFTKQGESIQKGQSELEKYNSTVKKTASSSKELWAGFSAEALGYDRVNAELKKLTQSHQSAEAEMDRVRNKFVTVGNGVNSYIVNMNKLSSTTIRSAESFAVAQKELMALSKTLTKNTTTANIANGMNLLNTQYNRAVSNVKAFNTAQKELLTIANNITTSNITKGMALLDQQYKKATQSVKTFTNAQKELLSVSRGITQTNLQSNISAGMNLLNKQYDSYVSRINSMKNVGTSSVINNASGQFARARMEVEQLSNSATKASANVEKLSGAENQASASATKLGTSTRSASTSMQTLNTATSTLKNSLSGLKMVATALSSMFIWTFGMSLWEATKQTTQSKNEMESYLKQMGMGRGAINLFNQGLDETADKFKKLNKYMIGETIAGIGMEFDLTASQMKESMEVVAMIQNEYVRAGRKESEATLAVKDILQGEFLRLSRETGVGKQDLIDTGLWSGDLKDVMGLMEALKQVGESRHWELFASKCNSLNDVVSETKNRFSEFSASLVDQFSPAIITAFNGLVAVIEKITGTWDSFDPTTRMLVGTGIALSFGTALMMVAGNMSLVDIATIGYGKSLLTTLLKLDIATVKEYGFVKALVSKITALEGATVAEIGNTKAILSRLLGLDTAIVKEFGMTTALNVATGALDINSMSYDANSVAQVLNNGVTEEGTAVVGAFTVVKELEDAVINADSETTAFNTFVHELNAKTIEEETVSVWGLIGAMTALKAIAFTAVIAGIAVALGSLAMEAQNAKEKIDGFYDILDNGDSYIEDSEKNIESLTKQYDNLSTKIAEAKAKGEDPWKLEQSQKIVEKDLDIAKKNLKDIKNVNDLAKKSAEDFQNQILNANTDFERKNAEIFKKLGKTEEEARVEASNYTQQYLDGMDQMRIATQAYVQELDVGQKHMAENVESLQQQGIKQEVINQYVKDYGQEVLKNAQYHKEWAEGDFWALPKIALSELKLAWIDLTAFLSQYEWAKDLARIFGEIKDNLKDVYIDDFKKLGEDVKLLCDALDELYHWIKGEKGTKTQEYLDKINREHPEQNPQNYMDDKGGMDIPSYVKDNIESAPQKLSQIIMDTFSKPTSPVGGITFWLMKILFPDNFSSDVQTMFTDGINNAFHSFDWIGTVFDAFTSIFSGNGSDGSGRSRKGQGVSKHIDIKALLDSWIGGIDFNGITEWFNQTIAYPFGEAVSAFVSDPLGIIGGLTFDTLSFISGLFGMSEEFAIFSDFVYNNIALPLKNELDLFFQDPLAYVGGMLGNMGSFLTGLLSGDSDTYTTMYTWVTDNVVNPFGSAITNGMMSIHIVGDILGLLGLTDSEPVTSDANNRGSNVGSAFGTAVENKIRSIPILGDVLSWLGIIDGANDDAHDKGHNVGKNIHDGVDSGKQGTAQLVRDEVQEILNAIGNKIGEAWDKASQLGSAISNGLNSTLQHFSPGIPAQLVIAEMGEIVLAMDSAEDSIYASAQNIGNAIVSGIQPNTDIQFDAEQMAQYQANTMMAMGMADETVATTETAFGQLDYNTMLTFGSIGTTIGTTMTNIANSTKTNFTNVANTTKTQLTNMQSQTTKNIGMIKTSWNEMQVALINSAEHIRSETGSKIQSLQSNMGTFWRKVQNPALLLGAGTQSEDHSVKKHRSISSTSPVRSILSSRKMFAGSPNISRSNSNPRGASTGTGISDKLPNRTVNGIKIYDILNEYLECLKDGKPCYAGGWGFNWSDDIKSALLKWHTHFGEIYDHYLYVGKFENDTFPVRGIAPIALRYIQDAISRTNYDYYFNERYSPLEAWNRGAFNCVDGARLAIALASAFGFGGGYYGHTTWDGIGHVYAVIPGLGIIDATAIQGGYGLTAGKVSYGAGGDVKPMFKHKGGNSSTGNNIGDITINVDLRGADVSDDSIGERIGVRVKEEIIDLLSPNPTTGQ